MLIRWLTSLQKSRSSSRKTRWERQSKTRSTHLSTYLLAHKAPASSLSVCAYPVASLPPLPGKQTWSSAPPLPPLSSHSRFSALGQRLSFPCYQIHMFSVWSFRPLSETNTYGVDLHKTFFFYGHDFSLSFFSFHIKRYEIWASGGGDGRESGLFWVVLGALLLSTAFHIPEWRVCSETPSSSTLTSSMCPINVNDQ